MSRNDLAAWYDFLNRSAVEVNGLIIKNANLKIFQNKITPFAQKWEKHKAEIKQLEKKREKHWQKVKSNHRLRNKNAGPPKKGWEWDPGFCREIRHSELIKVDYVLDGIAKTEYIPNYPHIEMPARLGKKYIEAVKGYITKNERRKKKYTPRSVDYQNLQEAINEQRKNIAIVRAQIKGLKQKQISSTLIVAPVCWWSYLGKPDEEFLGCWRPPQKKVVENPLDRLTPLLGTDKLPPPRDKTEEYERYYVTLASIHDNQRSSSQSITKDIWPEKLAKDIWYLISKRESFEPNQHFIEVALNRVKADLPKPPADNGDDTPITLREFMKNYCVPLSVNLVNSRVESLLRLARRKQKQNIKLKHIGQWKQGRSYNYLLSYLIENWPTYQEKLPGLPNLKAPLSSK